MSTKGIFESFSNKSQGGVDSPFSVAPGSGEESPAASPFSAAARQDSPFSVVDEGAEASQDGFGKPVKLPERRKPDSPFQVAEPSEGFGFEAPGKAFGASPFDPAPAQSTLAASPFSAAQSTPAASPFSTEPQKAASNPTQAAISAFTEWQEPVAPPAPAPERPVNVPSAFAPETTPAAAVAAAAAAAPSSEPAAQPKAEPAGQESLSDSFNIRQLELRAIFGVDREMTADEMLQRSRALPGMRNIARVGAADMATIEGVKNLLPNLGFGSGALKLYAGSVPLEFIREGSVMLAVQTDGGFAPGVRETLMIVARELGRL